MKHHHSVFLKSAFVVMMASLSQNALADHQDFNAQACTYKNIPLHGHVQIVDSYPDIKVQKVDSFNDLNVKKVDSFPYQCGEFQFVESFPDFKIQFVDSFPDMTIRYVESFPGTGQ